jgi:hypothetical protein
VLAILAIMAVAGLVGCQSGASSSGPSSGGPVIVAAGDIACGPTDHPQLTNDTSSEVSVCRQMATSNLVQRIHPTAVLELGDNQYPVGRYKSYERFAPQDPSGHADPSGIREFVVGTGGKSHYQFKTIRPNSVARNDTASGVLVMTLHPDGYSWRFVSADGSFQDSGTARCHGAGGGK